VLLLLQIMQEDSTIINIDAPYHFERVYLNCICNFAHTMPMEKKHFKIRIKGKVQGVSFRAYAKSKANELNIDGFTKNLPDGTVYIEAEAEEEILLQFIDWCHFGSPRAQVKSVEIETGSLKGFGNFEVKY